MKYFIGNWKLNPKTVKEAVTLYKAVAKVKKPKDTVVAVCAPLPYLKSLQAEKIKTVGIGVQNVFYENEGAYTGECGPSILEQFGVKYTLVGHSEVRERGDTDEIINKKISAVFKTTITPILCVGEKTRDDAHWHFHFVKEQLLAALAGVSKKQVMGMLFAYEPVWAIGKNAVREATVEECEEMAIFIRRVLSDLYDTKTAESVPILYGGSVNADNARVFIDRGGIQGLLIGRASLDKKAFEKIVTL